jgi:hypothetical protein
VTGDGDREGPRDGRIDPVDGAPVGPAAGATEPDESVEPVERPARAEQTERPARADDVELPARPDRPERPGRDPAEIDVESAFAAIVAGYGALPVPGVGPWPAAEDVDTEDDRRRGAVRRDLPDEPYPDPRPAAPAAAGARRIIPGEPVEEYDEPVDAEGYEPPEPPPLPRMDLVSRLAWAGVLGGPVFLLLAALLWSGLPTALLLGALAAFVGGFVTLVARLPGTPPDDPDAGAVV